MQTQVPFATGPVPVPIVIPMPAAANPNQIVFEERQNVYAIFLFANPISGNTRASAFTNLQTKLLQFKFQEPRPDKKTDFKYDVDVFIYNLVDKDDRDAGFKRLGEEVARGFYNIRVVSCGGDGTPVWVLEEMIKRNIEVSKVPLGSMPFGTGNDLAIVLGWGREVEEGFLGENFNKFKIQIQQWIHARIEDFDIWEVIIDVMPEGAIRKIVKRDGVAVKEDIRHDGSKILKMTRKMSNYMSIGVDARIGFGFDKNRSQSKIVNKCVYCWEGVKKFFLNTLRVKQFIHHFGTHSYQDTAGAIGAHDMQTVPVMPVFDIEAPKGDVQPNPNGIRLSGNPVCLVGQNIPSYMGGEANPWVNARGKVGLKKHDGTAVPDNFEEQKFGDGKLEFMCFESQLGLGAEVILAGRANRVGQGSGPFIVKFKPVGENNQELRTYLNIDGEYWQLVRPVQLIIQHARDLPNGKARMLVRDPNF